MTGCRFPEHHGHGSAGVPAAVVAILVAGAVVAVCVSHAGAITEALWAILAGMGALASAAVVLLVRLLASSRSAVMPPPALPSALPSAASRAAAIAARSAECGRGRLPAPAPVRAIAAPARPVPAIVTAEILAREDARDAPRP